MKKFSKILIVISGFFFLNNFFGADGKYHNSKEFIEKLDKAEIIEPMDIINIGKAQKDIILNLQRSLDLIIDFEKKEDNPTKVNDKLFHLSGNGQKVVIPEKWSFGYSFSSVKEAIASFINLITDIAIGVFAYNNIYNTQLQEKINQYLLTTTNWNFCFIKSGELKIVKVGNSDEYASLDFLKSLDSSEGKSEANKIIANLTKLYSQIPDLKKDKLDTSLIDNNDKSFTDYDFNENKSSKEVMESFARIAQTIFADLELSHFKLEKIGGSNDKNWSFKIGNDSMTVFTTKSGPKNKVISLVTEKKLVNVQDVEEMVEKIDFAAPKKEDKDPSNKFKNNNPGSSNNSGSSNDSSNSDPQGGKKQFGLPVVIGTGLTFGAIGVTSTYLFTSTKSDKDSDKNQNPSMDNYPKYEESFDKLQTGAAAA
jgi:hypothetical protein